MTKGFVSRLLSWKRGSKGKDSENNPNLRKKSSSVSPERKTELEVKQLLRRRSTNNKCQYKEGPQPSPSTSKPPKWRMSHCSYSAQELINELSPDESVIDYTFLSEENFLLIILLTSNAELQVFCQIGTDVPRRKTLSLKGLCGNSCNPVALTLGPEAGFVVLALADGDVLIIPIKLVLEVTWSSGHFFTDPVPVIITVPRSTELCLAQPTSLACYNTMHAKRPVAIVANKAGQILVVDLAVRKLTIEMSAPQSIHAIEIIQSQEAVDLLVTGFTGAQWMVPLENSEESMRELLSRLVPTDLKQIEPPGSSLMRVPEGIAILNTTDNTVEVYSTLALVGGIPKRRYKVPSDTWVVCCTEKVLFTVAKQTDLRFGVHLGLPVIKLDFNKVNPEMDWRILGIIPSTSTAQRMPHCFVVNERGLVRVQPSNAGQICGFAAEFLFRSAIFSQTLCQQVSQKCGLDADVLLKTLLPKILLERKGRRLSQQELIKVIGMAKTLQTDMDRLLDLFARNGIDDQLLPEVLRCVDADKKCSLKKHVIDLYVKKLTREREGSPGARNKTDLELSLWLTRHTDVCTPVDPVIKNHLWRSASILAQRTQISQQQLVDFVLKSSTELLNDSDEEAKLQLLACLLCIRWEWLQAEAAYPLASLLISIPKTSAHHEMCLRIALQNAEKFPKASAVLYLVSAMSMYLLSKDETSLSSLLCRKQPLCGGYNCSVALTVDDKITMFGEMGAAQQRSPDVQGKVPELANGGRNSTPDGSPKNKMSAPKPITKTTYSLMNCRPHLVACGMEHCVILTTSHRLYSFGRNRFGQCGLGHEFPVEQPTMLEGEYPHIVSLSCGQYHTGFVLDDGSVYTWGWGMYGQLGRGQLSGSRDVWTPQRVPGLPEKMVSIACGRVHTVLLSETGRVYVSGGGTYGQHATKTDAKKKFAFSPVTLVPGSAEQPKVVKIATKYYHTVVVTEDNRLFEWGKNPQELKMKMFVMRRLRNAALEKEKERADEEGVIGIKKPPPLPCDIPRDFLGVSEVHHLLDSNVTAISTGLSHTAVITQTGNLFTWGKSLDYQLGHGNKTERLEPHQVFDPPDTQWLDVQCGGHFTLATTSDGRVFAWGRNDFGQMGMRSEKTPQSPRKLFFKAKEGVRRCVQLPDDSSFVIRPQPIPDLQCPVPIPTEEMAEALDSGQLISRLRNGDAAVLETASAHFENSAPKLHSVPIAFLHLMCGNVRAAVLTVDAVRKQRGDELGSDLTQLCSLIWDVIANEEDCHNEELLTLAFTSLPVTPKIKQNRQLRDLWASVWKNEDTQAELTPDDKAEMLAAWNPVLRASNSVEIDAAVAKSINGRVRVWAECGHVEPPSDQEQCAECARQWLKVASEALEQT